MYSDSQVKNLTLDPKDPKDILRLLAFTLAFQAGTAKNVSLL